MLTKATPKSASARTRRRRYPRASNIDDDDEYRIHQRLTRPKSKFMNSSGLPCLFPPPESLLELANQ